MRLLNRWFHFIETRPLGDRVIAKILVSLSFAVLLIIVAEASMRATVPVPLSGGVLKEGIVGAPPRYINPVLAVTRADRDLSALVYSGIMKRGEQGELAPDLAESLTISDDGLTYNVVLRENIFFHDGTRVTTDDIVFTITKTQEPDIKSPERGNWDGVTIEQISAQEINFVLPQPYAPFIENLTIGILPRHIWEGVSAEQFAFSNKNAEPIGSGPYTLHEIKRNKSGIPESYTLNASDTYVHGTPHIQALQFFFFAEEEDLMQALTEKTIDSAANLSPASVTRMMDMPDIKERVVVHHTPLPRTFILFFNQNESIALRDSGARKALSIALDRDRIVEEVLLGYGTALDGPLPPTLDKRNATASTSSRSRADEAEEMLRSEGWKRSEVNGLWEKNISGETITLRFSLSIQNTPSFKATADQLVAAWETIGVPVEIKQFEQSDFTQTVVRPRKYDTLLFGTALGREEDYYSFWHSSQRSDPGVNVALYANITVDTLLSQARSTRDADRRSELHQQFAETLLKDTPAIFLYAPDFIYLLPHTIHNVDINGIASADERMSHIEDWYIQTERIWNFLNI